MLQLARYGLLLGFLSSCLFVTNAQAARSFAIGYDLARQFDVHQDDGQVNLTVQGSVGRRSAIVVDVAQGEKYTTLEIGFKRYNEKYLSGSYFQLGAGYWYGDEDKGAKSSLGADLRLGYEQPLTQSFVAYGAVSMVYGQYDPLTNEKESLQVRPHLGLMFHF